MLLDFSLDHQERYPLFPWVKRSEEYTREDSKNVKKHGKNGTLKTRCAPQCVELTNEPETLAKFTAELRARGFTGEQIVLISKALTESGLEVVAVEPVGG